MATHMKTTVEISDPLLERAKRLAAERGSTLRDLIETGLKRVLEEERSAKPFKLRDLRVSGNGLQEDFRSASWEQIRDAAYGGPGG
jgi:antitoxin component of RelBE/YafQ-DinJ toxin-antitoxin module